MYFKTFHLVNSLSLLPILILASACVSLRSGPSAVNGKIRQGAANSNYNRYIERYASIAYENQKRYKIPASITLAQGLLESAAGQSRLAVEANNHFGIKCHRSWQGKKIYKSDDRPNECFRAYSSPEDSFRDHARFLGRKRYRKLFDLSPSNYKAWAKGLQKCGYATDRGYANKLIKIIEDNALYLIDKGNPARKFTYHEPQKKTIDTHKKTRTLEVPSSTIEEIRSRDTYLNADLLYIIAKSGDQLATIAEAFQISEKRLCQYNDFPPAYPLTAGDIVYLNPKRRTATPPHYEHCVQVGESIHTIAQTYGIKLSSLYSLNGLSPDYIPKEGDCLKLR